MRAPRPSGRLLIAGALGVAVIAAAMVAIVPANQASEAVVLAPTLVPTTVSTQVVELAATQAVPVPAAATPLPTLAPTAEPAQLNQTQFERLLRPFLLEASRRRQQAAAEDPTYWTRVDPRLNASRVSFLLFGYGETHEPPLTERAFIGSLTIFSYDYATRSIDLVSLTHDIRAPEAERYLAAQGQQDVGPIKIDRVYSFGGFDLLRRTVEDATGLAIDFELAFKESAIADMTDRVFGGLDVDVPMSFDVNAYYLDGTKYPAGSFTKGLQHLNGTQVIQFIKTVPVEQNYDPALEHNERKHLVFRALMDAMRQHASDVGFMGRAALFFGSQVSNDAIAFDFDLKGLLVSNLLGMMRAPGTDAGGADQVPSVERTLYVVDPASGDGGVQWVTANAHDNPITRADLDAHTYGELAMEVPYHGDPYAADLVSGYWPDVRRLIAARLAD